MCSLWWTLYGLLVAHLWWWMVYVVCRRIGWVVQITTVVEHSQHFKDGGKL